MNRTRITAVALAAVALTMSGTGVALSASPAPHTTTPTGTGSLSAAWSEPPGTVAPTGDNDVTAHFGKVLPAGLKVTADMPYGVPLPAGVSAMPTAIPFSKKASNGETVTGTIVSSAAQDLSTLTFNLTAGPRVPDPTKKGKTRPTMSMTAGLAETKTWKSVAVPDPVNGLMVARGWTRERALAEFGGVDPISYTGAILSDGTVIPATQTAPDWVVKKAASPSATDCRWAPICLVPGKPVLQYTSLNQNTGGYANIYSVWYSQLLDTTSQGQVVGEVFQSSFIVNGCPFLTACRFPTYADTWMYHYPKSPKTGRINSYLGWTPGSQAQSVNGCATFNAGLSYKDGSFGVQGNVCDGYIGPHGPMNFAAPARPAGPLFGPQWDNSIFSSGGTYYGMNGADLMMINEWGGKYFATNFRWAY